jgi:hypothetical protein
MEASMIPKQMFHKTRVFNTFDEVRNPNFRGDNHPQIADHKAKMNFIKQRQDAEHRPLYANEGELD